MSIWRKIWGTMSRPTTLAKTSNTEIVGWKYTVPCLIALAVLVALYYFMGWELP
jgi:hypothetical protein